MSGRWISGRAGRRSETGLALVLVVVVLAALAGILAPFLLSMRLEERSADGFQAARRAEMAARAGVELGVLQAMRTHPSRERDRAKGAGQLAASGEDWDDLSELLASFPDLPGAEPFRVRDPNGTIVDVRIEDEQGKLDLRTAPAHVISNLLGVTVLLADVTAESEELLLEDARPFFTDHDPETIDGLLWLSGGELIAYRDIVEEALPEVDPADGPGAEAEAGSAGMASPDGMATGTRAAPAADDLASLSVRYRVRGLVRDAYLSAPTAQQLEHVQGTLVRDARGIKVALHPYWRTIGEVHPFRTVAEVRAIADWSILDVYLAGLFRRGYTADDLQALGLGGDALGEAGGVRALERERALEAAREKTEAEARAAGEASEDPPALPKGKRRSATRAGSYLDRATRRHGRRGGQAWLRKAFGAADLSDPKAKAFVEAAREMMEQRAAYERKVFREAGATLGALGAARDVEVLGAREYARIRPFLTVHAVRSAEWAGGALVLNRVWPNAKETASGLVIGVEIPGCRGGAVARVEGPGGKLELRRVVGYRRPQGGRPGVIQLWPQLKGTYKEETARVFAAPTHAVNVNTAPREVLRAVLVGLSGGRGDLVTPREADALVARLIDAAPIDGPEALRRLVTQAATEGVISGADARAVLGNALDEEARVGARTVPLGFRSGGTFTVEGTGIVSDPAGGELARRVIREVVAVAPPDIVTLHLDSQHDFFGGFKDPRRDQLSWRPADRRANLLETDPVPLRLSRMLEWPNRSHEPGVGRMRLATGEVGGRVGKGGVLKLEHYREEWDGKRIEGSGLSLGPPPTQKDPYGTWPEEVIAPGFLEVWLKVDDPGRSFTVFDLGQRERTDRLVLTYDGVGQQLSFRAYDASIEARDAAHLRAPLPLRADAWFHVAAAWRGTRPGDLALFVDGLPVGEDVGLAHLQAAIDENATTLTVRNARAIPVPGPVRVGREVVEVVSRRGDQLVVRTAPGTGPGSPPVIPIGRGARGTAAEKHEADTQVMPWGYTGFFVATIPGLPFDLAKIHRGGSALVYPLPPETPMALLLPPGPLASALVFEDETSLPVVAKGRTLQQRGFPPRGFLQVHHELVYYDRLEPFAFSGCVRKVWGWIQDDQQALVPPPVPPNPKAGYRAYTPIVLASIEVQDASDYENLDALPPGVGLDALRGFWAAIDGPSPQKKEWIRYARAHALPNPQTGQPDPRWRNILLLCDTAQGFGTQPRTGGRTNAVSTNDRQWPRADGFRPDGVAKYQALLQQLQQDAGGQIPPLFMPGHIHIGMEWGRGLFRSDPPAGRLHHPAGAALIPAHAVTRPYAGAGDRVTILDSQPLTPFRQEMRVWDAVSSLRLLLPTGRARRLPFYLLAFEGFLPQRPYEAAKGARFVKRPSGDLPLVAPSELRFGASYTGGEEPATPGGTFQGWLDELKLSRDETNAGMTHPAEGRAATGRNVIPEPMPPISQLGSVFHQARRGMIPLAERLGAGAESVGLTPNWGRLGRGVNRTGVLLRLDDEVIGVSRFENRRFLSLARGMLGTKPEAHSVESPVYVLPFPPAVRLQTGVGARGQVRYTGVHPSTEALPRRGVLMVDAKNGGGVRELLSYEPGKGRSIRLPLDDRLQPAYRGAFGTTPNAPLGEGTLAIAFPFRFFDRYKVGVDSDEGAFFEARFTPAGQDGARVARFLSVGWDETPISAEVGVVVLARIDGHPAWTAQPTNQPGGLYRFDDPNPQKNRIDVTGRTIEVRCVFLFRAGAYARGGWKESPSVDAIRVEYARPVTVLEVQDATPSG